MAFIDTIEALRSRADDMAAFVHALAHELGKPVFSKQERSFRYTKPTDLHFCLLRSCRIVSAMYSSLLLCEKGFAQETFVIQRTVLEFCSQVDYVIAERDENGQLSGKARRFIEDFFADDWAPRERKEKRVKLRQEDVHDKVAAHMQRMIDDDETTPNLSKMMSTSYISFSHYVHGRHVESMDLYGDQPGHFHLFGMSGTPKDQELIEVLETMMLTAEQCLIGLIHGFSLWNLVKADKQITAWYARFFSEIPPS